jgi:hypothetical protein
MAEKRKVEHIIKTKEGRIGQRRSYGNDPYPPRGSPVTRSASNPDARLCGGLRCAGLISPAGGGRQCRAAVCCPMRKLAV